MMVRTERVSVAARRSRRVSIMAIIVGTPEDAIEKIQALVDLSGGFGTVLCFAHEWAPTHKVLKSYELLMRYVAPVFQGHMERLTWARDYVEDNRRGIFGATPKAMAKAFDDQQRFDGDGA